MNSIQSAVAIFALCLFCLIPASAQELAPPAAPAQPDHWEIKITSTGGFHGLGDGGVSVASNGEATVSDLKKSCQVKLPEEKFQEVHQSFLAWKSEMSSASLNRTGFEPGVSAGAVCCDLIQYTVHITYGGPNLATQSFSESWPQFREISGLKTSEKLRQDLLELRKSFLKTCQ